MHRTMAFALVFVCLISTKVAQARNPCGPSPIIIDTTGQGFQLTSADHGVLFDIRGDGHALRMAWTAARSSNAFLALDRNHNGIIDSGLELFGNFTAQVSSAEPNGFLALAAFDAPEAGGNGDGIIDARDRVYSQLLLWIDANHNGAAEPNELFPLAERGILSISLRYVESRRVDDFGNEFRFRAKVTRAGRPGRIPWAYDVFLVEAP